MRSTDHGTLDQYVRDIRERLAKMGYPDHRSFVFRLCSVIVVFEF